MEAAHLPSGTSKGNNNVVNIKILIIPDYIDYIGTFGSLYAC